MTVIELNRVHYPVTALGPGTRAGIWLQGCTLACPGCLARDTWAADPARAVPVSDLLDWLGELPDGLDGITISGGEPFQQPSALAELVAGISRWRAGRPIDVLAYSGYAWSRIRRHTNVLAHCDAVVTGPYIARRNTGATPLRGSANQSLIPLTPLGRQRYETAFPARPPLQAFPEGDRVWLIGVPGPGELERLRAGLGEAGIVTEDVTWK